MHPFVYKPLCRHKTEHDRAGSASLNVIGGMALNFHTDNQGREAEIERWRVCRTCARNKQYKAEEDVKEQEE